MPNSTARTLRSGDALIVVDMQNDFLPGGALPVPNGNEVIPPLNRWIDHFAEARLPILATRDWHPPGHCSFTAQGGPWPSHCVADTHGAAFAADLPLPAGCLIVSKATRPEDEAYSGFSGTDLDLRLRQMNIRRLFVGGLATDYCVLQTVLDARRLGYEVELLAKAIRAVEVKPGDGERAIASMIAAGARLRED